MRECPICNKKQSDENKYCEYCWGYGKAVPVIKTTSTANLEPLKVATLPHSSKKP